MFDGQPVQSELVRYGCELLLGRAIEPDPGQAAAGLARVVHLCQLDRFGRALAIPIDRAIDDHRTNAIASLSRGPDIALGLSTA